MFSILQKPQDTVNAEDLETLQNELERCLVSVVTQKWELERDFIALNNTSPDLNNPSTTVGATNATSQQAPNILSGKLRNSHRVNSHVENSVENSTDCFESSLFRLGNNGTLGGSTSGTNSNEDSVSSEGSLVSSLTSSTIITATVPDLGSQTQTTNSNNNQSGVKRSHRFTNDRPSKRFRQNSSATGAFTKRPPHSKHRSKIVPSKFRNSLEESRPNKKQILKNEAPDKLWPFVEQFCATPTEDQIKELDEMVKAIENDKDYFKVPALGKKESTTKESTPAKSDTSNSSSKNQRKSKSRAAEEETGLGALTQRLVSSFMEESDEIGNDVSKSGSEITQTKEKKKNSKTRNNKSIDINNAKNLERRIRQELEEYDILDQQDDIPYTSEDDEVLRELVASQHELLVVQRQNKDSMQRLLKRAKKHLELENEREKLREANADVIAAYQRLIQAKQRKRNPSKREKDAAWKALKVQDAIYKKCDELYLSSLNRGKIQ